MAGFSLAKLLFAGAWAMAIAVILPFAGLFCLHPPLRPA
jgi:hypothetical protein